MARIA